MDRLERTPLRPELGRAHLLFGEWLRREGRETEARNRPQTAYETLSGLDVRAFAERARTELAELGVRVRRRGEPATALAALTNQEALIVRLAAEGHTNATIGAQLFLSARTVEWHLRKAFGKIGVSSRRDLAEALTELGHLTKRARSSGDPLGTTRSARGGTNRKSGNAMSCRGSALCALDVRKHLTPCSGGQGVAGSNPVVPTRF
ncbi:helix-turn-helix transcriptional regulator [Nonomuraea sp. NPDC001636]|uniref:response regulator transcription factor n=1 Tax=Nonomuraea sp. NPDC001636 TaxID=3154391 RepID=UPI00333354D0